MATSHDLLLVVPGGDRLPVGPPPANHGKTKAAWVTFWLLMVGATAVCLGMVLQVMPVIIAGAVITLLSPVVGLALRAAGLGQVAGGAGDAH